MSKPWSTPGWLGWGPQKPDYDERDHEIETDENLDKRWSFGENKSVESTSTSVKINAKVLWSSGEFCVVKAVYPRGFIRSLTRSDFLAACNSKLQLMAREGTSAPAYALTMLKYVTANSNEYGELAP